MNTTRSAVPGFAIAVAVLIAGLLLALTVGRYPVSLGDLFSVLFARMTGHRAVAPSLSFC
jgi:iron complex transport system permease protein